MSAEQLIDIQAAIQTRQDGNDKPPVNAGTNPLESDEGISYHIFIYVHILIAHVILTMNQNCRWLRVSETIPEKRGQETKIKESLSKNRSLKESTKTRAVFKTAGGIAVVPDIQKPTKVENFLIIILINIKQISTCLCLYIWLVNLVRKEIERIQEIKNKFQLKPKGKQIKIYKSRTLEGRLYQTYPDRKSVV